MNQTTLNTNNKMELAAISWCFGIDDLDQLFHTVQQTGFTAIQFCGNHKKYKPEAVVAAAKKYNITIASYDPGSARPENKELATIKNAVKCFYDVIDFASTIGAPMVTLQSLGFWTVNSGTYQQAMEFVIEACKDICAYAKQKNILTTYEACCHYEIPVVQDSDDLIQLFNAVKSDNLMLVLDSFHMNITESDMIQPIHKIGRLLHSYHVSDSGRGGIGTGKTDFLQQYRALKNIGFNGLVCFEFSTKNNRPYKLPMNSDDMQEFIGQTKQSLAIWRSYMEQYS